MKKSYLPIVLFGCLLAVLTMILQLTEYKYVIGKLDVDLYTAIVATLFTLVGIWVGSQILRKNTSPSSPSPTPSPIDPEQIKALKLNPREYEVLQLIAKGHSNQEIADQLFLALPTIKTHVSNLYSKLDVRSRTQAVHKARQLQLIEG